MGAFLSSEKTHHAAFKAASPLFTDAAHFDGAYRHHCYPFCLPMENAAENLYPGIRDAALRYFAVNQIHWHDGKENNPSNHMCDSQVC